MEKIFKGEIQSNAWDIERTNVQELSYAEKQAFDLICDFQHMLENANFEGLEDLFEDMNRCFEDAYGVDFIAAKCDDLKELFTQYEDNDFFNTFKWNMSTIYLGLRKGGLEVVA